MAHKRLRSALREVNQEKTALLFASAQLAANLKTFNHLLDSKYTDYNAIEFAMQATEGTRRVIRDAVAGKDAIS